MIQKALSIRAPWWWFILHGGKDIENRDWPTSFRGTVYVHASKWWSWRAVSHDIEDVLTIKEYNGIRFSTTEPLTGRRLMAAGGCIVGKVDVVDCIQGYKRVCDASPWFFGEYGFVLANPVAFAKPVPCKGALGFFTVPDHVLLKLRNAEVSA